MFFSINPPPPPITGNGYLNTQEINWIPRTAFLTLAAALDFASVWPDPYVTQPRSQIERNAVELAKYDGIHYIEPASETYWTCQPRNVYGYTHNRSRKKDKSTVKKVLYPGLFFIGVWAAIYFLIFR